MKDSHFSISTFFKLDFASEIKNKSVRNYIILLTHWNGDNNDVWLKVGVNIVWCQTFPLIWIHKIYTTEQMLYVLMYDSNIKWCILILLRVYFALHYWNSRDIYSNVLLLLLLKAWSVSWREEVEFQNVECKLKIFYWQLWTQRTFFIL